jgi:hypothetical protein
MLCLHVLNENYHSFKKNYESHNIVLLELWRLNKIKKVKRVIILCCWSYGDLIKLSKSSTLSVKIK